MDFGGPVGAGGCVIEGELLFSYPTRAVLAVLQHRALEVAFEIATRGETALI